MLKLIIEDDEGRKTVVPFVRDEITIGRKEGNTIRLTERNVSRRHARLMRQNGHVLIEDLGSYNGIRINGDRIAGQVQVSDGDLIQIGDYDLALQAEEHAATVPLDAHTPRTLAPTGKLPDPGATLPALPAIEMPQASDEDVQEVGSDPPPIDQSRNQSTAVIRVDQIEGSSRKRQVAQIDPSDAPRLVVLNTDLAGREFPCTRTELRIGRTDDNDVALDHRSLSRTHCKVVREDNGEWRVIDLQSANGLMVNGEPYAQVTLRYGDVIELGHVKIQFVGPGEAVSMPSGTSATADIEPVASRAPLFAVIAAAAVIIIGGGGYALLKNRTPVERPTPPAKTTPVATTPPTDRDPRPSVATEPTQPDPAPETARKAIAEKIAEAKVAIDALDFTRAEALLKDSKIDGVIAPEAQQLLTKVENERGFKNALEQAARFLETNDDEKAKGFLESAAPTMLLASRYKELEAKRARLMAERLKKAQPPGPTDGKSKGEVADAWLKEGRALMKNKEYRAAIIRLERCTLTDPLRAECYKWLGSCYAKVAANDAPNPTEQAADQAKARRYYERFLELAPNDDSAEKVREILKSEQ